MPVLTGLSRWDEKYTQVIHMARRYIDIATRFSAAPVFTKLTFPRAVVPLNNRAPSIDYNRK